MTDCPESGPGSARLRRILREGGLSDYLPLGLLVVDRDLRILAWNRWVAERTGLEPVEVLGRPLLEIFPELEEPERLNYFKEALAGEAQVLSHRLHRYLVRLPAGPLGGEQAEMRQTVRLVPLHEDEEVVGVAVSIEDVTERYLRERELLDLVRRLEEAARELSKKEEQFRAVFESALDALLVISDEAVIELANPAAARIFGRSSLELQGSNLLDLVTEEHRSLVATALAEVRDHIRGAGPLEAKFRDTRGSELLLEIAFEPLSGGAEDRDQRAYLFQGRDITDRRKMEKALRQAEEQFWFSQKAEAVTLLAGGVAHDFNNLLSIILGFSELTLQTMPEDDPNRPNLEEIRAAATRASEVTNDLLCFTGRRPARRGPVTIAPVIQEVLRLYRRSLPSGIEMRELIELTEETVFGDKSQLEQVIVNLCANAAAALRGREDGLIEVEAKRCTVEQSEEPLQEIVPGDYVCISVSDNAEPLDAEARQRLFDPYFDPYGKGTGRSLGLAASLGIVRSHGGFLTVLSRPGVGNTIQAFLPLHSGSPAPLYSAPAAPTEKVRGKESPQEGARILAVESQPAWARLLQEALTTDGYQVTTAMTVQQALDAVRNARRSFDLVILGAPPFDMTVDLLARLLAGPLGNTPVLWFASQEERFAAGRPEGLRLEGYLTKPARHAELLASVREILDRVTGGRSSQLPPQDGEQLTSEESATQ